jgi:hypothetical protein
MSLNLITDLSRHFRTLEADVMKAAAALRSPRQSHLDVEADF